MGKQSSLSGCAGCLVFAVVGVLGLGFYVGSRPVKPPPTAAERAATSKAAADKEAQRQAAAKEKELAKTKDEGETLHIGYTSYCAWKSHWADRLSSNQFLNQRANASWLFVTMTVRNDDRKPRMIPPIQLLDEEGREYQSSGAATMIENSIGVLETLNPGVSKEGYIVFDVPKGRTYRLKVSGGYWSGDTGYIRLKPTDGPT